MCERDRDKRNTNLKFVAFCTCVMARMLRICFIIFLATVSPPSLGRETRAMATLSLAFPLFIIIPHNILEVPREFQAAPDDHT